MTLILKKLRESFKTTGRGGGSVFFFSNHDVHTLNGCVGSKQSVTIIGCSNWVMELPVPVLLHMGNIYTIRAQLDDSVLSVSINVTIATAH